MYGYIEYGKKVSLSDDKSKAMYMAPTKQIEWLPAPGKEIEQPVNLNQEKPRALYW